MAVSKKGHRKVRVRGKEYIWHVADMKKQVPPEGFVAPVSERYLHIIASDKKFIVHYRQPLTGDADALLEIEGPLFPRQPGAKEVRVPRWRHDTKRYPTADFVRRLINWSLEDV